MQCKMPRRYFVLLVMIGATVFNYLSVDRSAVRTAGGLLWKGERYVEAEAGEYCNEVDFVGKTTDGEWLKADLKVDPEMNCLVVRSFLDQFSYVKEKHIKSQRYDHDKFLYIYKGM